MSVFFGAILRFDICDSWFFVKAAASSLYDYIPMSSISFAVTFADEYFLFPSDKKYELTRDSAANVTMAYSG